MTQAYNLSQLANNLNTAGQLDATDGLVNAVPIANGGTGASDASAARSNLSVPSTTGSGASGTWGINISGNAATATNATNATNATYASSPASGGSFITSSNIGSQSVSSATTATKLATTSGSAPVYGARAWVVFNGATGAIYAGGNVSSVTKNTTGDYTINFSSALPDGNYAITGFANSFSDGLGDQAGLVTTVNSAVPTSSSCRITVANSYNGDVFDSPRVSVAFFR